MMGKELQKIGKILAEAIKTVQEEALIRREYEKALQEIIDEVPFIAHRYWKRRISIYPILHYDLKYIQDPMDKRRKAFLIGHTIVRRKECRVVDDETKREILRLQAKIGDLHKQIGKLREEQQEILRKNWRRFKPLSDSMVKEWLGLRDQLLAKVKSKKGGIQVRP